MIRVWGVWKNNRLVGYVKGANEFEALQSAKSKFGENLYVEISWLGNPIPEGQNYTYSYSKQNYTYSYSKQ